jgi:hypothetical protein
MKPYGWRVPNKHQYLCHCVHCRDEVSSPRAREKSWAGELIAEQIESIPANDCDAGTCDECAAYSARS